MAAVPVAGSFRDPAGHVFEKGGRIYRSVTPVGMENYRRVGETGFLNAAVERGMVVDSVEVDRKVIDVPGERAEIVLEHPRIPFVSYPYEWSFEELKCAALFHLDLQQFALTYGVTLSDATAYNIQFVGPNPVFIDVLSFRPYREGEYWIAHRQFCEQFLNPLILRSHLGVAHNAFFRGNLEGVGVEDLSRLLPAWRKFTSWTLFSQVHLQASLQSGATRNNGSRGADGSARKPLQKEAFVMMLGQLRNWISKLRPKDKTKTVWADYAHDHSYDDEESAAKRKFVAEFASKTKPEVLWDLGCNTGDFSVEALRSGAKTVIGFDFDQNTLDAAFNRARTENLNFLPLFLDAANPSPGQGWAHRERMSLMDRANANSVMALAFEHHLAIGKNVPLDQVVDWIVSMGPSGVIEFVPKSDPMIQKMLSLRDDIFADYNIENFETALARNARIIKSQKVSKSGRVLYWYDKQK